MTKPSNAQLRRRVRELEKDRAFLLEASTPEARRVYRAAMRWHREADSMGYESVDTLPTKKSLRIACRAAAKAAKGKK